MLFNLSLGRYKDILIEFTRKPRNSSSCVGTKIDFPLFKTKPRLDNRLTSMVVCSKDKSQDSAIMSMSSR